ncbi:MAG: PEP/pyruvate-binding domain-containing protein [Verrucomicrobia bacterium]|nr:PEP/pyruvate-binding domain-containing protein [Verrucomicrobiota bacterium]
MTSTLTTGLPGLDEVLKGVMPGDNIVWKVETIADYKALVVPYVEAAHRLRRRLIYFRFASHEQLVPDNLGAEIHHPNPDLGFETFVTQVHRVIEEAGKGAIYVFDCLSELADKWQSDQALGNFFVLTCPRLCDLETVTYFALYRNYHSTDYGLAPITTTTQFLLDVFRHQGHLYIRPIKVQYRSTSSMNTMHVWEGDAFKPITNSAIIAGVLTAAKWPGLHASGRLGFWNRIFANAQKVRESFKAGHCPAEKEQEAFDHLSSMVLSRDETILKLAAKYLTLEDVLAIRDRMIGVGLIGGKAVGMLLARAILKKANPRFEDLLEAHDSFYVGSHVFYTFLVRNGVWRIRQKQHNPETFLEGLDEARAIILGGKFPDYTVEQLAQMLDYFGEAPYIVRSSSLLEDNYGNAFAGKYDSVFCVNQGTREQRLQALLDTLRRVYASAMSERALRYRLCRGLLDRDEQMALLIMRVSGSAYGTAFYPQVAGVGFSYNPYVWNKEIDPKAGVVRLVFGLGTRAVDRADDDYTRVVALNAPEKRPEGNFDEVCEYSQRRVDYLDLAANRLVSNYFCDLLEDKPDLPLDMFTSPDSGQNRVLTFDRLLKRTNFVKDLRDILRILEGAYQYPVDIEFTANFVDDQNYKINLLQCRPLQVQGADQAKLPKISIPAEDRIIEAHGAVIGQSRIVNVERIIYVVPALYGKLPISQRYEVARLIGRINQAGVADSQKVMLLGPGRWGTTSPELGIPVNFAEINRVAVLCEIVAMRENLIPDVSLGTHFLNELVEMNMLYLALFPQQSQNHLNEDFFLNAPNRLLDLVPQAGQWKELVRVINVADLPKDRQIVTVRADALEQHVVVYCHPPAEEAAQGN